MIDAFGKGLIPGSTHPCIGAEGDQGRGALAARGRTTSSSRPTAATARRWSRASTRGDDGRADGARDRRLQGQGRLDAPLRAVRRPRLDERDRGRATSRWPAAPRCRASSGGPGQVVLCFFGDGASCEGEFFEAMNMAMLWKVPLVFVCENNGIAISVPTSKSQATPDIADRARGFGMPAAIVDGNDVLAVREAVAEGVARARAGGARRSSSARPCAGSATPRSPPAAAIRRSSAAPGSGSTRSRASGSRSSPGASRRTPTSTSSTRRCAPRCARSATRRSAPPFPAPESIYEDIFAP